MAMKIIVHGFEDYEWTEETFLSMLASSSALVGAEADCYITVDGTTKKASEWCKDKNMYNKLKNSLRNTWNEND